MIRKNHLFSTRVTYSPLQLEPTFFVFPIERSYFRGGRKLPKCNAKSTHFLSNVCINIESFSMSFGSKNFQWFLSYKPSKLKVQKKIRFNKEILRKNDFFLYFQLWRMVTPEPLGVQKQNIPHWKSQISSCLEPELQGHGSTLPCTTPFWKRPFYTIQVQLCHLIWI